MFTITPPDPSYTKFLGLQIDQNVDWNKHIEMIIPKLSSACFALGTMNALLHQDVVRMIYFSYFHSVMKYGIIFWGNSSHSSGVYSIEAR